MVHRAAVAVAAVACSFGRRAPTVGRRQVHWACSLGAYGGSGAFPGGLSAAAYASSEALPENLLGRLRRSRSQAWALGR